jgi:Sugar kinases, ribokinase family
MKILIYGSLNNDITYTVPHISMPGETLSSTSRSVRPGGKGANQAAAVGKAGAPCFLAGKIGESDTALLKRLNECKVNTEYVLTNGSSTGEAIIQIAENGENSIVLSPGANHELKIEEIGKTLDCFEKGDIMMLQNETNQINALILAARTRGIKVIFNPSPVTDDVFSLPLDFVDLFFVNEIEAAMLAKEDGDYSHLLDKLCEKYPEAEIVLTAGSHGAYYGYKEKRAYSDIFPVKVVDTTSAGDTFSGFFIAARYFYNCSVEDSLKLASKASSLAVSRLGSLDSIPDGKEVFIGQGRREEDYR